MSDYRIMNQSGVRQCVMQSPSTHNSSWDSILAPDGKLYFSVCSELSTSEYAKLAVYDTDANKITELFNSKNYIFPNDRFIRSSKFHTSFAWLNDGRLIMLTHTTDKAPCHPAWMPLPYYSNPWEGFIGSSILIYDIKTNTVENLGIPVFRETMYGGAYDRINNIYYTLGFMKGHLYAIDLNDRSVKDYGQAVERASYRLIAGSDDNIYFSTRNGVLQRVNVRTKKIENLRHQLPYIKEPGRLRPYISYAVNGPDGNLFLAGMHDEHLSRYDPNTDQFSIVGSYLPPDPYINKIESSHYLGCMAFDKNHVLYYVVCRPRKDRKEDYKIPAILMRWDFFAGKDPEYLGLAGTEERVVTTTSSMLMNHKNDFMYIIGSNHADDGPDITAVDLSQYRANACTLGPAAKDMLVYPGNNCYKKHAAEIQEGISIQVENPYIFNAGPVMPVPLWQTFDDNDIEDSAVISLQWENFNLIAICGKLKFYRIIIDIHGNILCRNEIKKPPEISKPKFNNLELPSYPGRQYKRNVTHAVKLSGGRMLAANGDGLLAVVNGDSVFSAGPAWINGVVRDMAAAKDKSKVYGVAGDKDDINIVFSYSDTEGVRWLGTVACDIAEHGSHSSPELSSVALNDDDTCIAIGSGERLGTVYLYKLKEQ